MGMVVISSSLAVGPIAQTLGENGEPLGEGGKALMRTFPRFADDLVDRGRQGAAAEEGRAVLKGAARDRRAVSVPDQDRRRYKLY
jgi:hypothetical protein